MIEESEYIRIGIEKIYGYYSATMLGMISYE